MSDLREKIEEAWWKIETRTDLGLKLMPTPKEHKNLLGGKQQFLDAAVEAVKAHIEGCDEPRKPYEYGSVRGEAFKKGIERYRQALMESLE